MSELDYTKIERPVEPAFANEDPEGWCEVLAWEEARADRLEQENAELKKALSIVHKMCSAMTGPAYSKLPIHNHVKKLLNK